MHKITQSTGSYAKKRHNKLVLTESRVWQQKENKRTAKNIDTRMSNYNIKRNLTSILQLHNLGCSAWMCYPGQKKRPLRLCIKSEHCSNHGILKNKACWASVCSDARSRGQPRHHANPWSCWYHGYRMIRAVFWFYYRKRGSVSYIVREWLLWVVERERETPVTSIDITLKSRVIMHMITSTARRERVDA